MLLLPITTLPQGRLPSPSPLDLGSPAVPLDISSSSSFHHDDINNNVQSTPVAPDFSPLTPDQITSPPGRLTAQKWEYFGNSLSSFYQDDIKYNGQSTPVAPGFFPRTPDQITSSPGRLATQEWKYADRLCKLARQAWRAYMDLQIHGFGRARSRSPPVFLTSPPLPSSPALPSDSDSESGSDSGYAADDEESSYDSTATAIHNAIIPSLEVQNPPWQPFRLPSAASPGEEGFLKGEYNLHSYTDERRFGSVGPPPGLPPIDTQTAIYNLLAVTATLPGPGRLPSLLHALPPLDTSDPPGDPPKPSPVFVGYADEVTVIDSNHANSDDSASASASSEGSMVLDHDDASASNEGSMEVDHDDADASADSEGSMEVDHDDDGGASASSEGSMEVDHDDSDDDVPEEKLTVAEENRKLRAFLEMIATRKLKAF
ncbi:MAG: hypothetical protein LQ342_005522 [Letrouitia transgressa]|nr:MAG: hypothetical protein LQ342_005522 [Letrouitia transgressa]